MDLAKQYQKKTDKQHILDNPDTYIGSVENVENNSWVFEDNTIVNKQVEYIPGLYKLFDEGIVNCRDHVIRMKKQKETNENTNVVSYINISIEDDGTIEMINDGDGIDVAKHPEYDLWIPEMIFGHLRTSTNYNKDEKKIVGGKNGFGFKLVLIWSTYGYIETVDSVRKLKYCQTFENNLDVLGKPTIRKCSTKPYTKIRFKPDYARLGISSLTDSMKSLMIKRVYDIAAITDTSVKVKYNSELVPVKNFVQYVDKYLDDSSKKIHEDCGEHWEYIVSLAPTNEFTQVSFVNGINTSKGGKHVDYILNQITKKMIAYIEKKKKVVVSANIIKEQLIIFVRCNIENPSFDSQTKDYMNTPVSKFGSSCSVSNKFIEKLAKLGIVERACALSEIKENKQAKKNDGTKSKNIKGIPKLIDANWAGTEKSNMCTIIFCEGDSAKAGIVSGLSSTDRNIIGVYPMKGKLLNVRGETNKKVMDNKEIIEIKKILGLESNKTYTSELIKTNLRYGKILFMTDQDLDGSHIKGLGINLFDSLWSSLSKVDGFMGFMNTPIIKAKKNSQTLLFYNDGEYETWKKNNNTSGWKIKYYKGLGTSTGSEFKEYFQNKKIVYFNHLGESSINAIDKVFNKKRADDRKDWLSLYSRNSYLNTNNETVSYDDFIDREMIHFSKYDCDRSIPNIMDGLKISLRKILYSAFKKNLTNEIKVAQFSGYVSEHSGYHHGEASLNSAIVGLAQNYVGSNNINLFCPNGQFGTRLQGGKDSASERYIFTQLNQITRDIFVKDDDNILKYLHDDGLPVEPIYYVPIIPMILVNGSKGIGTGFSTEILPYNVKSIIEYLRCKLTNKDVSNVEFNPYFEDFEGSVNKTEDNRYIVRGLYDKVDENTIIIKELPVGVWTDDYKQYLETRMETTDKNGKKITPYIKQYDDMSKSTNVNIKIKFHKDMLKKIMKNKSNFEKLLKLTTTFSTTNMHLFDANEKLKKYETVNEIIDDYYEKRLELYDVRKKHNIKMLENELIVLYNKKKYLEEILTDKLDFRKKKKTEIYELLKTHKFDIIEDDDEYKYLLKMPMDSVNEENVVKCVSDYKNKSKDLEDIKKITIENMWLGELDKLLVSYDKYLKLRHSSKKSEK
tara:strand:+ start:610 stop:3987 length:3378 start_codon:yes stop_codon:yes gene_type:complete